MQTKTIAIAGAASRFLSLKANFKQIKKWLLPAAFFLAFAFVAAPAAGQVNITAEVPTNPFSNYQVFFNVTFTTAQTGLSASNFTLTGTVTGASIQSVAGSGTSWGVTVEISNSYQSSGTLILNMVNNTGVSPGVSGLPVASPSVTDVLYPLTGSATLTSFNANPGYAKTGDIIDIDVISDHYFINQVSGSVGNGNDFATGPANGSQGGVPVTLGSGIPQGPLAYTWGFYTIYETLGGGSGTSGIIFDSIDPTVSISAPSATTVTGNGTSSVSYAVTYADANFGNSNLTASGITLNSTGSTTGTVSVSGSGTSYTVTISNIIGAGTLGISVGAGYAADLAGNTDTGAGPSSTVTVQLAQPSISYTGPNLYPINTAITPLAPVETIGTAAFASTTASNGLALDYNGNAYIIASTSEIIQYQPGNANAFPLPANSTANIAVTAISGSTSTLLIGIGGSFRAMDINNGTFSPPVTICSTSGTGNLVAATHPASGPEIAMINKGFDPGGQIAFVTRTGGTWSSPALIANAFPGSAITINNYPGGLKLAYIGTDNDLYYATYSGGAWSAVAPWATPNISLSGVTAFALDAQGNVWYGNGIALNELTPGSTSPVTVATLSSAPNAIAFDIAGNLYANLGTTIEKLAVINNFQVSPALPAGLSINSATGVISGTPTTISPATQYTVTAVAGGSNLSATINIQTITTPTLSYGSAVNATVGTAITAITPTGSSILPQKYNSTPTIFASVSAPTGLAIDASGNVYVNQSAGTTGISSFPAAGGTPTALNVGFPGSIFIDAAANLYAPNSLPAAEFTFTMYPGGVTTTSFTFGGGAPYGNTLTNVQGLVVDQAGNVYAGGASTDGVTSTNKVYEYPNRLSQNGNFGALAIGTGFTSVSGVAADAAGNIYVSDAGAGSIDVIPANRGQWTTLASGVGAPANVCIDGAGNLYFSDNSANTISELPAGSTTPVLIASGLGSITALAIDGQGNLFAADNTNSVIDKFVPTGGYYISPVLPSGMSFNGATGVISGLPVAGSSATNYTITAYNTLGNVSATQNITVTATLPVLSYGSALSFSIGETIVPVTPTSTGVATQGYSTVPSFIDHQFGAPYGLAVDTALNVYVADLYNFANHTLTINPGGSNMFANWMFPKGNGLPFSFLNPNTQVTSVAIDSTGNLYADEFYPGRISKLTPYPAFTESVLIANSSFFGLTTDTHGNLFGAFGNSLAQIIPSGTTILASEFNNLAGIAIDGSGNTYLSDAGANTVYKLPAGSPVPILSISNLNTPGQLAADGTGNIFIADGGNGVIKELPAGAGAATTIISGLKTPHGVAVDINGALYVADEGFGQVRKYTPSGGYYISPALPAGLSFNNSTGVISGTPTAVTPVKDYKITAYNASGSTQTKIRFGVTLPSSALAGLTTSMGTISPAFASATTAYSVSVSYNTSQITVTPTTVDGSATVTVNGTAVSSGSPSGAIALSVGANTITVVVTASDHSSTQTYMVTVTRAGPSNNALLSNVGVGYVISGSTVEAVVTPATSDPNATVTVNGVTVASGAASSPIPLSPGSNSITIVVTAQDGLTKMTYKITVDGPLGSTSTLSSLTISAGTLSPAFSPGTTSYTDAVNNSVASVTVTPTTTDSNATVTVNAATVASGTPSNAIGLNVGNNTISTLVTAQDGVTQTTYTITVMRAAYPAALSALAVSSGTFSPAFAQATLNYTESVPYTTAQIAITPTTAYPTATVTVNGTAVTSGTASGLITLPVGINTINTVVTASDGVTKQTYTLVVTRAPSTNATLSAITLNHGTLSPTFAAGTFSYTATVPYATTSVTLKPVAGNASATIKVNGAIATSNTASGAIALNVGSNLITTIVTAQDGVTMDTYTVTITRLPVSTNATLAGIVPNKGALSPIFASGTTSYTVMETNGTASIGITPTAADPTATITINGTAVASGASSAAIALSVGSNTITILVTAQDGVTKDTYTLNVIRPSTNAKLSNLVLSSGTLSPVFAGATTAYTASVANAVTSITLTPTVAAAGATVLINGMAVASGSPSGVTALSVGSNTITTVVTAQDGVTTFTYTVTVTRAKSSNANLANITLNKGTLSPAFTSTTTSYTDMVTNGITAVTLTPTVQDNTAMLTVNGTAVASGSASGSLALAVGSNTETVAVTAQDGTVQTYTVNVIRPSTNAKLSALKLSSGTLTPAFNTNTVSYTASVPYTISTIMITPTVAVTGATVKVNGTTVTSGTPSAAVALSVGGNTITTVVTAQDGTTTDTYTVVVTRANPSINNNLSNLTISKGTLSPAFTAAITGYSDLVTNGTTSLTVTPSLADATATVTVNGTPVTSGTPSAAIALGVGGNTINIIVTAQSGATQTYAVTVIRPSTNAKLANLTTNAGAITPVFNPAATSYTLSVTNATTSLTITPTVAVTGATVKVNGTTVASGTPSAAIALSVGSNTITTVVTAQDGVTTATYTINVTRAAPGANIPDETVSVDKPIETLDLANDGINVHQGLSPNGDGINDFLQIDHIASYPDNNLKIMNRNGQLVYEAKGYDNATKAFDGHSNKNGQMQLPGTYFYALDYTVNGIIKHKTGFLVLKY